MRMSRIGAGKVWDGARRYLMEATRAPVNLARRTEEARYCAGPLKLGDILADAVFA